MSNQKNSPETGEVCRAKPQRINNNGNSDYKLKPNTKTYNIVNLFCQGKKLSCLDHYWHFDTCLHSTVSGLSKRFNLTIPRTTTRLPNRQGRLVSVALYWFNNDDIAKMKSLISGGIK